MGAVTLNRDEVVRELTRHCGDGRLTLDELEERIQEAYVATTDAELHHALRDLPSASPVVADPPPTPRPATPSLPPLPPLPTVHRSRPVRHEQPEWEKAVGALFVIGGFVLLFNGMFWLAMLCWFVLPGIVIRNRGR